MARFNIPRKDDFLCVGVITQAHSLHGEVLVKSFLDDESLLEKGTVLTTADDKEMTIQKVRPSNKGLLVKFEEVKNRNDAEQSRKIYLYLSHEEFPQEDEDEIYYFELKQFKAVNDNGDVVGKVISVFNNGANTILELKLANPVEVEEKAVKKVLIPFSNDMVTDVNKDDFELTLDTELLDMYINL